jgi:hypothetical protein
MLFLSKNMARLIKLHGNDSVFVETQEITRTIIISVPPILEDLFREWIDKLRADSVKVIIAKIYRHIWLLQVPQIKDWRGFREEFPKSVSLWLDIEV